MSNLFDITKVTIDADSLRACIVVKPDMPLLTSEDIEGTARVYYLAPGIAKHLCLGETGKEFQDCMGDTEMPHLLEHLAVEIMNQTGLAGKIACGRTRATSDEERTFEVQLSCPDDALTIGALSSAAFMMDWAYLAPDTPAPDFPGTVGALKQLVLNLRPVENDAPEVDGAADVVTAEDQPEEGAPVDEAVVSAEIASSESEVVPAEASAEDAFAEPVLAPEAEASFESEPTSESAPAYVEPPAVSTVPVAEPAVVAQSESAPAPLSADATALMPALNVDAIDATVVTTSAPSPIVSPASFFDDVSDGGEA